MAFKKSIILMLIIFIAGCRRSIHRPQDMSMPELTLSWQDDTSHCWKLRHNHLESHLFETYKPDFLEMHALPDTITPRNNPTASLSTATLIHQLEQVVQQLNTSKKKLHKLEHFTILKQRDYNPRRKSGLIVLKSKHYPLVVKLFMETPVSLARPFNKGIEECAFFYLGGGMNRFLVGFTRIANRECIYERLQNNPYWKQLVDVPRKWYWTPAHSRKIRFESNTIGNKKQIMITPSVYAIICDAIDAEYTFSLINTEQRHTAIALTEFLGLRIDPHINNFMLEKSTGKVILIDTEHFPTLVGITEPFHIHDYVSYYAQLFGKFLKQRLMYSKNKRSKIQNDPPDFLYSLPTTTVTT